MTKQDQLSITVLSDLNAQNETLNAKLVAAVERVTTLFRSNLQQIAQEAKLTPLQLQIVLFVAGHKSSLCSVTHLAEEFIVTKATVSDSVRALVGKGFLRKVIAVADSRRFHVELTAEGQQLFTTIENNQFDGLTEIALLPDDKKEQILLALLKVIEASARKGKVPARACLTCKYYERKEGGFYCHLVKAFLENKDLRVDCPEHEVR